MSYVEKEITVGELRELVSNGYEIELDTPDGYQSIGKWFDKGPLKMVEITTDNYQTRCAVNHMLQLETGEWFLAEELEIGDDVITETGIEKVQQIRFLDEEECYDFEILHPNHRYWGDGFSSHNSGKSYIASANLIKDAQSKDVFPVLFDTENALDNEWLQKLGVDTSEEKLMKVTVSLIDDVAKFVNQFVKDYKTQYEDTPFEDRPGVLFVLDSLGMLVTNTDKDQAEKGDMKGDMGRKAKAATALLRNTMSLIASQKIGMVVTNHTYESQDMFNPDPVISGGKMLEYSTSIIVALNRRKLKEDEEGNSTGSQVTGIRAAAQVRKSRYAKPFEKVEIRIPWEHGMDPYSGLFDLFEKKGLLVKEGNKYSYQSPFDDYHFKEFRKRITRDMYDRIMQDVTQSDQQKADTTQIEGVDYTATADLTEEEVQEMEGE